MPNWACTNYIATGDMDELQEFARTLNTMPDLLKGSPFGFGRYWMGNLLAAFGMTRDEIDESPIYCRGTFDPNFHAVACFCGPDVDEKDEFSVDADGRLRFSTVSAWASRTTWRSSSGQVPVDRVRLVIHRRVRQLPQHMQSGRVHRPAGIRP